MAACLELLRRSEYSRIRRWFQRLTEHRRKLLIQNLADSRGHTCFWHCGSLGLIRSVASADCNRSCADSSRRRLKAFWKKVWSNPATSSSKIRFWHGWTPGKSVWQFLKQPPTLNARKSNETSNWPSRTRARPKWRRWKRNGLDLKLELLESRSKKLEIKSPIRGIVLRGDQKRAEGMPVTLGQNLFEVAPLDKMVVEVAIPERDFTQAKVRPKSRSKTGCLSGPNCSKER